MATLQDLVPGSQTDVWGDILEQNLHAINDELMATTAKANAAPTTAQVNNAAATAEANAKAASEPRISRAGAAQGDVVSLGAGGALTFSTPSSGGGAIPTASSTTKGVLLLAGDLAGTSDLPTTPTAVHKTGNETIDGVKTFLKTPVFAEGTVTGANTLGTLSNPITDPNAIRPTGLTRVVWDTSTTPVNKLPQDYNLQRGSAPLLWYKAGSPPDGTVADRQVIARRRYDKFMSYCLATDGMPAGMPAGAYRIKAPNQGFHPTFALNATVSEGIGYGMLLCAWMGNLNLPDGIRVTNAQTVFNGLWTYYKHFRNANGLMNWHINPDGTVAATGGASDGDFDVAMALVIAHRQWGSGGAVNYRADATTLINAIRDFEFTPTTYTGVGGPNVMMNGDQWGVDTDRYMPDYFRPGFFREFGRHTGDTRWNDIIAKNYPIALGHFWTNNTGGVVPDGCTRASLSNGVEQYKTGYNAVRWWGIAADYLWNGSGANVLAHDMSNRMVAKAKTHWPLGGDVKAPSYDLNLAGPFETFGNGAGDSMFGLAALVSATHSTWAAQVLASIDADVEQSYFNNGLAAMAAMFMAGIAHPAV